MKASDSKEHRGGSQIGIKEPARSKETSPYKTPRKGALFGETILGRILMGEYTLYTQRK